MTENVSGHIEEVKEETPLTDQQPSENKEAVIEELVKILNRLFEPNNLCSNAYLTQRAAGVSFQIPVKVIYDEHKIKAKSHDREVINQALEKAENVIVNKKGDIVESVRPKKDQLRKNITVKGIGKEEEAQFKELVNSLEGAQEGIENLNVNPQLRIATILCKTEENAISLFHHLSKAQFKNAAIDCTLDFENLYILALDNLKGRGNPIGYQQNMSYMMPQYQQMQAFYFNQMNGGFMKNFYPSNNFYMQNPQMNTFNPNANGHNNWKSNKYNGAPKRGGYKKYRGERGGGRYYKSDRSSRQPTGVEVTEGDFPPLSNDNQTSQ